MFLDISSMGKQGSVLKQYTSKGSKVFIQGRLIFEQWQGQDGSNRSRHTLRVEEFKFLDSKKQSNDNQGSYNQNQAPQQQYNQPQQQEIPTIDIDDDSIPFNGGN